MRIPDHIIEQIRSQANIVDVVGEYVTLKKAGRNYLGLCPFHKEKSPSFNVNQERGMYKCFGCGKAGNAITFVQDHLHMTFPDAVRHLATKMGIVIPEEEVEDPTGMTQRRDAARAALRAAAEFYHETLTSSDGAPVRSFYERRGFSADIQERFGLGAAPAAWDHLLTHLEGSGFTREHLEDAGLIIVKEDGKVYDRFRGRAMFAIRDDAGRVVGFSARTLSNDPDSPKYINSPQSMVFDKSRVLYGLDLAKRSIIEKKTAHVVEGQADVIAMHQAGFLTTVASSGTALTPDHVKLLKKYAETLVLVFDADNAGQKAMSRGIEIGLAGGMEVRCVVLPAGEDPDSLIHTQGVGAMQNLLDHAVPWMTYQTDRYKAEGALSDPVQQANAVRTMLTWIAEIPDRLRHPFFVRQLSEMFVLDKDRLLSEFYAVSKHPPLPNSAPSVWQTRQGDKQRARPESSSIRNSLKQSLIDLGMLPYEIELLNIAVNERDGLELLVHQCAIHPFHFASPAARSLFDSIEYTAHEHHDFKDYLLSSVETDETHYTALTSLIGLGYETSPSWNKYGRERSDPETLRQVRDALIARQLILIENEIQSLIDYRNNSHDENAQRAALVKLSNLTKRLHEVRTKRDDPNYHDLSWLDVDTASRS